VRVFRQEFTLEDAIGSQWHSSRVSTPLSYRVHSVNCVWNLDKHSTGNGLGFHGPMCGALPLRQDSSIHGLGSAYWNTYLDVRLVLLEL
jgi:hypothetical protein